MTGSAGVVDFFSLVVSCYLVPLGGGPDVLAAAPADWRDRVAGTLESFRAPDGGYGKTPGAPHGSTYTSFLVALCLQLLDRPIPAPEKLAAFVKSRRRDDGGFVEIGAMKRSGTNPTAAAIGSLQILGELDDVGSAAHRGASSRALPSPFEGGLRANDRIPAADLLSTFTGGWTLDQLGARRPARLGEGPELRRGVRAAHRRLSRRAVGRSDRRRIHLLRSRHARAGRSDAGMTTRCHSF